MKHSILFFVLAINSLIAQQHKTEVLFENDSLSEFIASTFLFNSEIAEEYDFSNVLPLKSSENNILPLLNCHNMNFQKILDREIRKNPQWKKLIDTKKLAVGVVDLRDEKNIRFAKVNGDEMMYAASLPKIAVLLAVIDALEKREIIETEEIKKDMRLMISKSDNNATTRLINRLGYEKIENVLRDPLYNFYDENYGGGLWVGKRYASGGDTNREPLKNLSHAATVNQVCRFYYMLLNGQLVSKERSKQMLEIMKSPELHHKFVNTLDKIAPQANLFRKSGTWKSWHADSVLVWGKTRKYILVALVEDDNGEQIIRDIVIPVERAINAK